MLDASCVAASARAIKAVHPSLRVGGPATAALAHVADFVDACEKLGLPYDFVSTHHYPTDSCPKGVDWDPECFANGVLASRRAVAPTTPFYLTEYNVGCCLGYEGHDVSTAAAFVFRSVSELNEELDLYSYWTFTDVFEEGGLPHTEWVPARPSRMRPFFACQQCRRDCTPGLAGTRTCMVR